MTNEGAGLAPEQTEACVKAASIFCEVVIDLKDGDGRQVFRAASPDELIAKLAEAQTNATRKIRQQAATLRAYDTAPNLTEDDKRQLAARLLSDFDSVLRELVSPEAEAKIRDEEEARKGEEERAAQELRDAELFMEQTPSTC